MNNQTIKDDVYMEIDNEFDQIRTALGMYISKYGTLQMIWPFLSSANTVL